MKELVVLDSTCLIGLERIDFLPVLFELFEPIWIPPAVALEIGHSIHLIETVAVNETSLASILRMQLGPGESEALAIATEHDIRLVTDDKQARAAASRLGVKVIGTVGILLRAKRFGHIDEIRSFLNKLELVDFRIGQRLRSEALKLANEDE